MRPEGEDKSSQRSDKDCRPSDGQRGHVHEEICCGKGWGGTEMHSEDYWWYWPLQKTKITFHVSFAATSGHSLAPCTLTSPVNG